MRKIDTSVEKLICDDYRAGIISVKTIAAKYDVNACTVLAIRLRNNIPERIQARKCNRIPVNERYFENIDTEDKAYWLGFIAGDGCVDKKHETLTLDLGIIDKDHLQLFLNCIESDHIIRTRNRVNKITGNAYQTCCVAIYRAPLIDDLIKHGVGPNKSKELSISPTIPKELISHFIRGIVDSDGCWTLNKYNTLCFSIVSSVLSFSNELQKILMNECDLNQTVISATYNNKAYTFAYQGNIQTRKIFHYLYGNSKTYLNRKFQIGNELFKEYDKTSLSNDKTYHPCLELINCESNQLRK